jgi:hypothetical protein
MGIFGENKKEKLEKAAKKARDEKRRRLEEIIKSTEVSLPSVRKRSKYSVEYTSFLDEIKKKPKTAFEKICHFSEFFPTVSLGKQTDDSIKSDIASAYMNTTVHGVVSFAVLTFLLFFLFGTVSIFLFKDLIFSMVLFIMGLSIGYYMLNYPSQRAKTLVVKMSSDTVLAILYMIIYMRSNANLEGAIRFAADNLDGLLSYDLKKLLWDIEVGVYPTADAALASYVTKWKDNNKEFSEAINLLRGISSRRENRKELFDEILRIVLEGTAERTKGYVTNLRMPVMVIHAMGVLLPIMGLVLFPILVIFLSESVKPIFLFIGYDIVLPLVLWFFIDYILKSKPPTFYQPNISLVKGITPMGKFKFKGKLIPVLPVSVILFILIMLSGYLLGYSCFSIGGACTTEYMNLSVFFITALGMSIASYGYLDSKDKINIRADIEKIEDEFSVALFQLGNQISSGQPIEISINKAAENLKGLKITDMLHSIHYNMKNFGYTFERAIFDPRIGSIWKYPSKLIQSIMQTIVESSKKGMTATSNAMITVSKYLKGIHTVKQEVEEVLGETITSMNFLAMFLAPMISGLTITMAVIILEILTKLGEQISTLVVAEGGAGMSPIQYGAFFGAAFGGGALPIGPAEFQMIVGLYMVETVIILAMFINKIKYGDDAVGLRAVVGRTLMISIVVYLISWTLTGSLFGDPIARMLTPAV